MKTLKERNMEIKLEEKRNKRVALKRRITAAATCVSVFIGTTVSAFADTDPVSGINNLTDIICSIISAIGVLVLVWSVVQLGLAIKSHDPSRNSEAIIGMAAGLIIACAPWLAKQLL